MNPSEKIYVAGHQGLVGSALVRQLRARGYSSLVLRTHQELDLTDQPAVRDFFETERPAYVFLAAAKVGGIWANSTYPAEFIYQNILIQTHVIHEAYCAGTKRLLFLGSSCIYPRDAPQPMKEEYLLTGPLEPTNRAYSLAKISGIEMCRSYNRQYGTRFLCAMPTNLYGPGDNYDPRRSHVIPALIRKMEEASSNHQTEVVVWGTGTVRREFLFSDDAADACVFLMNLPEEEFDSLVASEATHSVVNVGSGQDLTILELAELIVEVTGFTGKLSCDPTKPDGAPRKLLDVARLTALGWKARTSLREGLAQAFEDYASRLSTTTVGRTSPGGNRCGLTDVPKRRITKDS